MFVLTYVAIVYAITLIMLERPWTLTCDLDRGLVVNLVAQPPLRALLDRACSATAAAEPGARSRCSGPRSSSSPAWPSPLAEGRSPARNRPSSRSACSHARVVGVVHHLMAPLGYARLVVDGLLYLVLVIAMGRCARAS